MFKILLDVSDHPENQFAVEFMAVLELWDLWEVIETLRPDLSKLHDFIILLEEFPKLLQCRMFQIIEVVGALEF